MTEGYELDHFIYGSHEGYKIKAYSKGVDVDLYSDAFMGFFIPISQSDVKYLKDARIILPVGDRNIVLSHIIKGTVDEYMRNTQGNHSVIIPKELLAQGTITYEDVDAAMDEWERENWNKAGELEKLKVVPRGEGFDVKDLKSYLSKDDTNKLLKKYKSDRDQKVFLYYKRSDAPQRIKLAYLLSMLVDVGLNIVPLAIFTDVPYPDAKKLFNLVIARNMISIKPDTGWAMVPAQAPPPESVVTRDGKDPLKQIYG